MKFWLVLLVVISALMLGAIAKDERNLQVGGGAEIRLCGSRLANVLSSVCERLGGYPMPNERSEAPRRFNYKRPMIEILRLLTRRQEPEVGSKVTVGTYGKSRASFSFQGGIVDECCKKKCSLSTLVSYCADGQQVGNASLEEILALENMNKSFISGKNLSGQKNKQINSGTLEDKNKASQNVNSSKNPNLAFAKRNRQGFIVLTSPQVQDQCLGEYSF